MSDIPKKSIETLAFKVLSQCAALATGILMARVLGPSGKGSFAFVASVFAMLLALNTGQSAAISWQYGRLKRPSGVVARAMFHILAYGGIPLAVVIAAVSIVVPGQAYLIAAAAALPFGFFSQMALGFYLADGKVRVYNIQVLIGSVGFLLLLLPVLLLFRLGIVGALACWLCASIGTALYSATVLRSYLQPSREITASHLTEQALFGLKASANSLVSFLNYQVDIFIIRFALGVSSLGVYSIAIGAGEVMWQFTNPLRQSAFRVINSGTRTESAVMTAKCVRHAMAIITAGCVMLYFVSPYLIPLVYGNAFSGAVTALRFLLPGIIAYSVMPFFTIFFTQQLGRPTIMLSILGLSTVVCATITLALVGHYGIIAGALGTSTSYCTAFLVSTLVFKRETGLSAKDLFGYSRQDVRPYRELVSLIWQRTLGLVLGRRA